MLLLFLFMSAFFNYLVSIDKNTIQWVPYTFINKTEHEVIIARLHENTLDRDFNEVNIDCLMQLQPTQQKVMQLTLVGEDKFFKSRVLIGWKKDKTLEVWEHSPTFMNGHPTSPCAVVKWSEECLRGKILTLDIVASQGKYMDLPPIKMKNKQEKID
jgi:hypothetical protein